MLSLARDFLDFCANSIPKKIDLYLFGHRYISFYCLAVETFLATFFIIFHIQYSYLFWLLRWTFLVEWICWNINTCENWWVLIEKQRESCDLNVEYALSINNVAQSALSLERSPLYIFSAQCRNERQIPLKHWPGACCSNSFSGPA